MKIFVLFSIGMLIQCYVFTQDISRGPDTGEIYFLGPTLINYYEHNRGIGHTELLKKGTEQYDQKYYIVASNLNHARDIVRQSKNQNAIPLTLLGTGSDKLRGSRYPMALDNSAIILLLRETYYEFDQLLIKNAELINKIIELENKPEPVYFIEEKSYSWREKISNWFKSQFTWLRNWWIQ